MDNYINEKEWPDSLKTYFKEKGENINIPQYYKCSTEHVSKDVNSYVKNYLGRNQGKVAFHVTTKTQYSEVTAIAAKLNCSVIIICEDGVDSDPVFINENTLIVPVDIIKNVKFEANEILEATVPEYYYYYNSMKIILLLLRPACLIHYGECGYKTLVANEICAKSKIKTKDLNDIETNGIEEFIRNNVPYGFPKDKIGLHIGCGLYRIPQWLNVDICCMTNGVFYLDAGRPFPFHDKTFEYIFSEHLFEHLDWEQGLNMLLECKRVLKDDGVMRISMPDMNFLIDLFVNPDKEINRKYIKWSMDKFLPQISDYYDKQVYMPEYVINNFFRDWGHRMIHTPKEFELLAQKCGFRNLTRASVGKSGIRALDNIEQHSRSMPSWTNELESFVFEMKK